jgi:hypothetical protein
VVTAIDGGPSGFARVATRTKRSQRLAAAKDEHLFVSGRNGARVKTTRVTNCCERVVPTTTAYLGISADKANAVARVDFKRTVMAQSSPKRIVV